MGDGPKPFRGSLQEIRLFVAAYEERSFTAAAAREDSTQSGVSSHIKQLEDILGVKLFVREKAGVVATPAGDQYYPEREGTNRRAVLVDDERRADRFHAVPLRNPEVTFAVFLLERTRTVLPPEAQAFVDMLVSEATSRTQRWVERFATRA